MEVLDPLPVDADPDAVVSEIRLPPDSAYAGEVRQAVERALEVVRPKAAYRACYVEERTEETVRLDGVVFTSRVLSVNLERAGRVFAYVATCGREIADFAATLDDPLARFALDTVMRKALTAAASAVRAHIVERFAIRRHATISPGSLDDWPLEQQRNLFALLGDLPSAIGVELTDSCLMVPVKSLSGILFPTEVGFESCQLCPREDCPGRRAPYDPSLWESRYGLPPTPGGQ